MILIHINQRGNKRMGDLKVIASVQCPLHQWLCAQRWFFPRCVAWTSHVVAEQLLCPPPAHALEDHTEDKSQEEK